MSSLHISINAEPLIHLGGFPITNSMATSAIITTLLIAFAIWANSKIKNTRRPVGLQNVLEALVDGFYGLTYSITQSHAKAAIFFPFIISFFVFILLNNWFGLLPGVGTIGIIENKEGVEVHSLVRPVSATEVAPKVTAEHEAVEGVPGGVGEELAETPEDKSVEAGHEGEEKGKFVPMFRAGTADLNTTIALALISVGLTQFFGIKYLGLHYFSKFFTIKGPIDTFVGLLEFVSEIAKIISFAFRLFGNIFAGEVLLAVTAFLVPIIVPIPFLGLEVFVGVIQALVFAMLSLVFINMATESHGGEAHS